MRIHYALVALGALVLSGCAPLGKTPYAAPPLPAPDAWRQGAGPAAAAAARDHWWRDFQDPALAALVEDALLRNNDLAAAAIAVRRARLLAGLTDRNALPQPSVTVGAGAARDLRGDAGATRSYSVSAGMAYEVDLWGKLSLQRDAAQWAAQAKEQDRQSVALSLIGTTMGLYWRAGYLNERIALAAQSIGHARQALDIARVKHAAGAIATLDVLQAEQTLASQHADLAQLEYQREENRTALALLFDAPSGVPLPEPEQLPDGPYPAIDAGLPVHLLSRRPDVRAAELRLRETLAAGDASRMGFYPALSLTGSLGAGSPALLSLLRNPAAALGAGLALPFIQWQEMKLNAGIARADHERAVIAFRQAFYRALGEVENALSRRQQLAGQADYLDQALATARKAERIAEIQYRAGTVPIKSWLDAQEARRSASTMAAANRLERLAAHAALYQALGGGAAVSPP
ncbi:TolC family protein [Pseudoduganella namucuonensis]|uniref:Efflux transporter, outer membrane factor (OMF) lipoprotein, NodT family n=1 Tax=Pseudoduganella namucuonensis TaxID=1035707 RepID=A0A1I7LW00_9BURK|nr:efflux transporter outer membrane subunit [Pseudoduganella namucuonensis]SFV13884.1 efflux transporter, outer membrane factor (OMF) lipoprotein, NodT family [Pseudoduganella namucuonensis]